MTKKIKCFTTCFLMFLMLIGSPLPIGAYFPESKSTITNSVTQMIGEKQNGLFKIEYLKEQSWVHIGNLSFNEIIQVKELKVKLISADEKILLRISQKGGGAAYLDSVKLGENAPIKIYDDQCQELIKLAVEDLDLLKVGPNGIILEFLKSSSNKLTISGRIENTVIGLIPFNFPLENTYKEITEDSTAYAYDLNSNYRTIVANGEISEIVNQAPFMKELVIPASGHPQGYIYAWVMNDDKNLYITMDVTADNTMDGDKDYAKVYLKTPTGIKEFKITASQTQWGQPGFVYTDKVAYQHKVYEFIIPLDILDTPNNKPLELIFSVYGTMAAPSQPSFKKATQYAASVDLSGITTGDFNNNGHLDFIVTNSNPGTFTFLKGRGDGTFGPPETTNTTVSGPSDPICEDFNNDGKLDFTLTSSQGLHLYLGNGDGTFQDCVDYGGFNTPTYTVADYMYGDDNLDLLVANARSSAGNISILTGNGDGSFNDKVDFSTYHGGNPIQPALTSLAVADFNKDTKPDIAVLDGSDRTFSILLDKSTEGNLSFIRKDPVIVVEDSLNNMCEIVAGNFNDDNYKDLAITYFSKSDAANGFISFYFGNGDGTFENTFTVVEVGRQASDITLGDFNDDGYVDYAIVNPMTSLVAVLPGVGWRPYSEATYFSVGNNSPRPIALVTGDFNEDGLDDIATANNSGNSVSILIQGEDITISDELAVSLARDALTFDTIKRNNTDPGNITGDLNLMNTGSNETEISWESSDDLFILPNGTVIQPSVDQGNKQVTLTATISRGSFWDTKEFVLTVIALQLTDEEAVAADQAALTFNQIKNNNTVPEKITGNLILPQLGQNGSTIKWVSSNTNLIDIKGNVTRPSSSQGNQSVTLTATLTKGDVQEAVVFNLVVIALPPSSGGRGGGSRIDHGVLQFNSEAYSVSEKSGSIKIEVVRTNGWDSTVSVKYMTINGTAISGLDYLPASGTLNFSSGEKMKSFEIMILKDSLKESNKTINLKLSDPMNASLGSTSSSILTIIDYPEKIILLTLGERTAMINNESFTLDIPPRLDSEASRTLVPLRFVGQSLGAQVEWLDKTQQVKISLDHQIILLTIGSKEVVVNDITSLIDVAPYIEDPGRIMVPLRFISENLGAEVYYDDVNEEITILQ